MNADQEALAEQIVEAKEAAAPLPVMPDSLTITDAYAVQTGVIRRQDARVVGFKSALSSRPAQQTFDMPEPVFGALLAESRVDSGYDCADLVMPMIEIEVGFRLGATLSAPLDAMDFNQVFNGTFIAIDLADVGFTSRPKGVDLITSNAAAGRFMVGPEFSCNDPNAIAMTLTQDGQVVTEGMSRDIGDQRELAIWLVNKALSLGHEVGSGTLIMTGAVGQIRPVEAGAYAATYVDATSHRRLGQFNFDIGAVASN